MEWTKSRRDLYDRNLLKIIARMERELCVEQLEHVRYILMDLFEHDRAKGQAGNRAYRGDLATSVHAIDRMLETGVVPYRLPRTIQLVLEQVIQHRN
jgi:hypothetical protein